MSIMPPFSIANLRVRAWNALTDFQEGSAALTCPKGHRLEPDFRQGLDIILSCPVCPCGFHMDLPDGLLERLLTPVYDVSSLYPTIPENPCRDIDAGGLSPLRDTSPRCDAAGRLRSADCYLTTATTAEAVYQIFLNTRTTPATFPPHDPETAQAVAETGRQVVREMTKQADAFQSLTWVEPVRLVATSPVRLRGLRGIDGRQTREGDRVLLIAQCHRSGKPDRNNGIWIVQTGKWRRPADYRGRVGNVYAFVEDGAKWRDTGWIQVDPGRVDEDAVRFSQFSGAGVTTTPEKPTSSGYRVRAVITEKMTHKGLPRIRDTQLRAGDLVLAVASRGDISLPSATNWIHRVSGYGYWQKVEKIEPKIGMEIAADDGSTWYLHEMKPYWHRGQQIHQFRWDTEPPATKRSPSFISEKLDGAKIGNLRMDQSHTSTTKPAFSEPGYNPAKIVEDYFFSHSTPEGRGSKIETLPVDTLGCLDDLKYFEKKLYSGITVPASYQPAFSEADATAGLAYLAKHRQQDMGFLPGSVAEKAAGSRPTGLVAGMVRDNSDTGTYEVYTGTHWTPVSSTTASLTGTTPVQSATTTIRLASTQFVVLGAPVTTVDGVAVQDGDKILLTAQGGSQKHSHVDNGIYVVRFGTLERSADFPHGMQIPASTYPTFVISEGTHAGEHWYPTALNPIQIGVTPFRVLCFHSPAAQPASTAISPTPFNIGTRPATAGGFITLTAGTGLRPTCLKCGDSHEPAGSGNRLCPACTGSDADVAIKLTPRGSGQITLSDPLRGQNVAVAHSDEAAWTPVAGLTRGVLNIVAGKAGTGKSFVNASLLSALPTCSDDDEPEDDEAGKSGFYTVSTTGSIGISIRGEATLPQIGARRKLAATDEQFMEVMQGIRYDRDEGQFMIPNVGYFSAARLCSIYGVTLHLPSSLMGVA